MSIYLVWYKRNCSITLDIKINIDYFFLLMVKIWLAKCSKSCRKFLTVSIDDGKCSIKDKVRNYIAIGTNTRGNVFLLNYFK